MAQGWGNGFCCSLASSNAAPSAQCCLDSLRMTFSGHSCQVVQPRAFRLAVGIPSQIWAVPRPSPLSRPMQQASLMPRRPSAGWLGWRSAFRRQSCWWMEQVVKKLGHGSGRCNYGAGLVIHLQVPWPHLQVYLQVAWRLPWFAGPDGEQRSWL